MGNKINKINKINKLLELKCIPLANIKLSVYNYNTALIGKCLWHRPYMYVPQRVRYCKERVTNILMEVCG